MTEKIEVPEGAVVVYPLEVVHELLGHTHVGSTRKQLSRNSIGAITGYPVDEVDEMIEDRVVEPGASWSRVKRVPPRKKVQ